MKEFSIEVALPETVQDFVDVISGGGMSKIERHAAEQAVETARRFALPLLEDIRAHIHADDDLVAHAILSGEICVFAGTLAYRTWSVDER